MATNGTPVDLAAFGAAVNELAPPKKAEPRPDQRARRRRPDPPPEMDEEEHERMETLDDPELVPDPEPAPAAKKTAAPRRLPRARTAASPIETKTVKVEATKTVKVTPPTRPAEPAPAPKAASRPSRPRKPEANNDSAVPVTTTPKVAVIPKAAVPSQLDWIIRCHRYPC